MIAKKKEGELDEAETDNAAEQGQPEESVLADAARTAAHAKPEAVAKAPETPRKPEPTPKAETKTPPPAKPQEKPKAKAEPEAPTKAVEPKSLAQVMKFDLKIRRRPRF